MSPQQRQVREPAPTALSPLASLPPRRTCTRILCCAHVPRRTPNLQKLAELTLSQASSLGRKPICLPNDNAGRICTSFLCCSCEPPRPPGCPKFTLRKAGSFTRRTCSLPNHPTCTSSLCCSFIFLHRQIKAVNLITISPLANPLQGAPVRAPCAAPDSPNPAQSKGSLPIMPLPSLPSHPTCTSSLCCS